MQSDPIVGSWQHRVSPGVVPVIVSPARSMTALEIIQRLEMVESAIDPNGFGGHFDADESDEDFDTPIVTIHEDIQEAAGG